MPSNRYTASPTRGRKKKRAESLGSGWMMGPKPALPQKGPWAGACCMDKLVGSFCWALDEPFCQSTTQIAFCILRADTVEKGQQLVGGGVALVKIRRGFRKAEGGPRSASKFLKNDVRRASCTWALAHYVVYVLHTGVNVLCMYLTFPVSAATPCGALRSHGFCNQNTRSLGVSGCKNDNDLRLGYSGTEGLENPRSTEATYICPGPSEVPTDTF